MESEPNRPLYFTLNPKSNPKRDFICNQVLKKQSSSNFHFASFPCNSLKQTALQFGVFEIPRGRNLVNKNFPRKLCQSISYPEANSVSLGFSVCFLVFRQWAVSSSLSQDIIAGKFDRLLV